MKYLIVTEQNNNYFYPYINDSNIDITNVYDLKSPMSDFMMRILRKYNLNHTKYINSNNIGKKYDMIVYFDISCNYRSLRYLKGNNNDVRLFLWNIVDDFIGRLKTENKEANMEYVKACFDKVYSFDKSDCEKYGLEYFPPLYSSQVMLENLTPKIDIVFLGAEKGRFEELENVYRLFRNYEQHYHIYKKGNRLTNNNGLTTSNEKVSYKKYLEWINETKCILDIPQDGQIGFTIRILEAAFLKKKLITTFSGIKNYLLYNPSNIYIVGEDDPERIEDFILSEYSEVNKEILSYYDCKTWLDNMKSNVVIPEGI